MIAIGSEYGITAIYGSVIGCGLFVPLLALVIILVIERFAPPAIRRLSILSGLVIGTLIAIPFGMADFSGAAQESWFGVSTPFHFGFPTFEVSAIIAVCIVGLVIMTETTGDILAVGEIVDKPVGAKQLADGLRADGLSTIIGGVFNTSPTPRAPRTSVWSPSPGSGPASWPPSPARC